MAANDVFAEVFLRADDEENGGAPPQPSPNLGKPRGGAYAHTKQQLFERYGLRTNPRKLRDKILDGQAEFLSYGEGGRLIYSVPVLTDGRRDETIWVKVVYAPPSTGEFKGVIITVLPPKWRREIREEKAAARLMAHREELRRRRKSFARDFRRENSADEDDLIPKNWQASYAERRGDLEYGTRR